ncbi:hypothetical protein L7F22_009714 [Adiantum nelumboides]|nr:hypothetical protein [Adiantum nelumboides]
MRVLAGEGEPYSGQRSANSPVGYLPQDPREGDLSVTAKDRVLSARGLDVLLAKMEKAQTAMAELADPAANDKAVREYGRLEERFSALGGYAAESEAARICAHLGLPDRVLAQPMRTLSGGQRRRVELARILFAATESGGSQRHHAAARRAHQPPRRRLDHLAARVPAAARGRSGRHQPRHRPAGRGGEQGLVPRRDPRRGRPVQHGLEAVPGGARHRREASSPRARQRREEGVRAARPGRQDGREGHQGRRRQEHGPPGRRPARRTRRRASGRPRRAHPVPDPGALRAHPAHRGEPVQGLRVAGGVHRGGPRGGPRVEGRGAGLQRRRQDHAAADPGRHRGARHRRGRARPRAAAGLLRPGARHARHGRLGLGQHPPRQPGRRRAAAADPARVVHVLRGAAPAARRDAVRRRAHPARPGRSGVLGGERAAARRADEQPGPGQPRAGARRAAPLRGRRRARDPRPGCGRGAGAGPGDRPARRHRGPLVGRLPGARPARVTGHRTQR